MTKNKKTHIILARHGETLENKEGILQGQEQGTLYVKGMNEMADLAEKLTNRNIDTIFCSDLDRSYFSATIIADYLDVKLKDTIMLRERDWGRYTGIKANINEILDDPSIENDEHLYLRASMFLNYIHYFYKETTILVVGHGCMNQAIMANIKKMPSSQLRSIPMMSNCDVIEFDI